MLLVINNELKSINNFAPLIIEVFKNGLPFSYKRENPFVRRVAFHVPTSAICAVEWKRHAILISFLNKYANIIQRSLCRNKPISHETSCEAEALFHKSFVAWIQSTSVLENKHLEMQTFIATLVTSFLLASMDCVRKYLLFLIFFFLSSHWARSAFSISDKKRDLINIPKVNLRFSLTLFLI